ncbi:hypothetical protein [Aestuariispira ectoiniformans]|uniref:hypothetical protein n=1 Tax=Aestuariispira ectoiniformans TaxID=2775080 RepID=UPI00223B2DB6|nr:hypothetical protein [Aestuariispira ectoiniformans]
MQWIKPGFGVFLAALTMSLWSISFWGGDLATSIFDTASPSGDSAILQTLDQNLAASGVYRFPGQPQDDPLALYQQAKQGPAGLLFFVKEGIDPLSIRAIISGFLHMLITALGLGVALCLFTKPGQRYRQRMGIVVLIGLVAVFFSRLGGVVWYVENLSYYLWTAFHDMGVYLLAGAILAMFIKHDGQPSKAPEFDMQDDVRLNDHHRSP